MKVSTAAMVALALVLPAAKAGATGGFNCEIKDNNLAFAVTSVTSGGMGGAVVSYQAAAHLALQGVPADLGKPDLAMTLAHHWQRYPDLKLHFYAQTQGDAPFASLEVTIETVASATDPSVYEGEYWVEVYFASDDSGIEAGGSVSCFVE